MGRKKRTRYTSAQKVEILKRHLVGKEEVSAICEELKLHPTNFYEWQRKFFEHGVRAFENESKSEERQLHVENTALKEKLARKDSALSELVEEHIRLKKTLGEA